MRYVVQYRLDDRAGTPGRCITDHRLERGETIYVGAGRAIVHACRPAELRPHPIPARTLHALSRINATK